MEVIDEDGAGPTSAELVGGTKEESKSDKIRPVCDDLVRYANSQYKSKKFSNVHLSEIKTGIAEILQLVTGIEKDTGYVVGRLAERLNIETVLSKEAGRVLIAPGLHHMRKH